MNSTPECVTKTPEIEAREKLAAIFSDAEQRGDNSKVSPELGKTAIDIENTSKMDSADNGAVDLCNQALGGYGKSLDYINNSPLETVQAIGNSLQLFREDKTKESCK
ncbi:hypothetical protein [Candidatus Minimicrobia sp. QA0096]|uniref:hypothetical protein n=1 Tax=Candidatus Minimicrobia sp. QA0096 TaxID=3118470 RepID=UPI0030CCBA80